MMSEEQRSNPSSRSRERVSALIDHVLALDPPLQYDVLRAIAPRILARLPPGQRRDLLHELAPDGAPGRARSPDEQTSTAPRGERAMARERRWPKGYARSDERIREEVCEALAASDELDAREIEIMVAAGEVSLAGRVPDRALKFVAEAIVDGVPGVREIHNALRVYTREERPRRQQRHESRAANTYHRFLDRLVQNLALPPERAESVAVAVLCALEQRLVPNEAMDLEAQLPSKLQDLLLSCPVWQPRPRDIDRRRFTELVADGLGVRGDEAEVYARGVFRTLNEQVSAGEIRQVKGMLPRDLQELWPS